MRVRRKSSDGRARHFWHTDNLSGGSGGGNPECNSVAESDLHLKWKSLAADRLEQVFKGNIRFCEMEYDIPAAYTDQDKRFADALVLFDEPDDELGQGIAVEVQHKNNSKDIHGATEDYIERNISVAWLDSDDFGQDRCLIGEIDFRHRARESVWPDHIPGRKMWSGTFSERFSSDWEKAKMRGLTASHVPARMPPEWHDEMAQDIWKKTDWQKIFDRQRVENENQLAGSHILDSVISDQGQRRTVPATLTKEVLDTLHYKNSDWDTIVDDGGVNMNVAGKSKITATVPINHWIAEEGPTNRLKYHLQHAHARNADKVPESASERKDVLSRVPQIVKHNTGGMQRNSTPKRVIKQIATNAGMQPVAIEWALQRLVINGDIQQTKDGRFSVS